MRELQGPFTVKTMSLFDENALIVEGGMSAERVLARFFLSYEFLTNTKNAPRFAPIFLSLSS